MKKRFMRFISALLIPAFLFQALGAGSEYYDHTTYPSQGAAGSSAAMRAELDLIESGFGKLPALSGNGGKVVGVNSGGTALEALTTTGTGSGVRATSPTLVTPTIGVATATSVNKVTITAPATSATLTLSDGSTLATSGGHSLTLTTTGSTNVTLPTSGTLLSSTGSVSNLLGGAAGKIPYQSAADTTAFTAAGSSSEVLLSGGTGSPTWAAQSSLSVGSSTNIAGGSAGTIPYQSGAGTTAMLAAGTAGYALIANGAAAPVWTDKTASTTVSGFVELATDAEVTTGTDTGRVPSVSSMRNSLIVLNAAVSVGTGSTVDWTGIPSWAKRVMVHFIGVSTAGDSNLALQGRVAGAAVTSGYTAVNGLIQNGVSGVTGSNSTMILLASGSAASTTIFGTVYWERLGTSNDWMVSYVVNVSSSPFVSTGSGYKAFAGALDGIRLTSDGGSALDAGSWSVSWE